MKCASVQYHVWCVYAYIKRIDMCHGSYYTYIKYKMGVRRGRGGGNGWNRDREIAIGREDVCCRAKHNWERVLCFALLFVVVYCRCCLALCVLLWVQADPVCTRWYIYCNSMNSEVPSIYLVRLWIRRDVDIVPTHRRKWERVFNSFDFERFRT